MDTLFMNGRFRTMDPACPETNAVLVREGRFLALGEEALRLAGDDAETVDLGGAAAYPGMADTHLHILNKACALRMLPLEQAGSKAELLRMVAERAQSAAAGEPLDGRGFNEDLWPEGTLPTRAELDAAAPENPVRLTRVCGHMAVANTAAMARAGVFGKPVPAGGGLDEERGIFTENALGLLFGASEDLGVDACAERLREGLSLAADRGLTMVASDDFGEGGFAAETVMAAYRRLEEAGELPVRVVQQCALPSAASLSSFLAAGHTFGEGSDLYRIGPRKLYADGSLGARTALLSRPYADAPETRGIAVYTPEALNRLAAESHAAGFPFIVHAIGDEAASRVLDAVEYARAAVPGSDALPDGIVHCQITTPALLERIVRLGVRVYAQPVFTEYDLHICRDRVGEALERTSYAWKTLLSRGALISAGSDCPVEPLDPALNLYCAMTRRDFAGAPEGGWLPEECLSVEEALSLHTTLAARTLCMEDRLGMIRPGFLADLTVFPAAVEEISPEALLSLRPVMTVLGGKCRRPGEPA